ncbi:TonB-dependent receptor plug domain protein [gut metagenome]|uniref:TonB-dependent receptor plug domain protein n=1 Tax=gut metagenome TaxID=749906 RepID=J9FR09_9ZZZZ
MNTAIAQTLSITGKVTDKLTKEGIIGASILVEGTTNGTITDFDGNFSLSNVPADGKLAVSYIGYAAQVIPVQGKTHFDIVLMEDTETLDEVVVVGYGVQKKVNLTGSVSSVKGDALEHRPVVDATQSLQGLVPGLTVSNGNSGRPGASGSLSLRGQGNLAGNAAPYVLVDGVEMDLADVNPSDIENISVLKDAAACAIYGARAAYGVILVTTKKGEEGKMRANYQGTVGWTTPTVLPDMVNSLDFVRFWNDGVNNAGASNRRYSDEKIAQLEQYMRDPSSINPWGDLKPGQSMNAVFENSEKGLGNTDYFDLHYKDFTFKHNHNVSFSGGGKKAQYYISGGYYNEDGILRYADMDYTRYNLNANISSQLTDWLKVKFNTKYMHSDSTSPFGDGGLSEGFYHSLARFRPTISPVDPNGHFTELSLVPYLQSGTYTDTGRDRLTLTAGFEMQPLKNWFIFFDYTYKQMNLEYEALNVAPYIYEQDNKTLTKVARSELGVSSDGKFTRANGRTRYQSINLYTNYLFTLADKHNFTLMAGYQEEDNDYSYMKNSITGLYSTSNPNVGMGTGDKMVVDTRNGWATRGFFGRINYDFDGRYLVELNGRYDGSSRFAKDNRWGFFPSVSLGWNINRESFMEKTSDYLSNLKLRASWGLLGNQANAGLYTFASNMSLNGGLGSYIFEDGRHIFTNPAGVIDPNTTWEKVESKNIGLDFGFFGNALTGTFDVFQRDTKDMLGPGQDFPDMFGAGAPQTNNARMRNRGWELALNWRGKIGSDIDYSVGGSISDAVSEVTEYNNPTFNNPGGAWYKDKKVGEIWGYRTDGLIQTQEEADAYNEKYNLGYISGKKWEPGDVKYKDLNGDNKIDRGNNRLGDMGDLTIIGNTTPRYQYTFNGSISWKGLSLSMMFQGVAKRNWVGGGAYFWGFGPFAQVTVFKEHMDYWTPENPGAYYPKPYINSAGAVGPFQNKNTQTSDRYMQSAAYCRLKNLTISYNLPSAWVQKAGLQKVQVFFSGENLLTFTSLKGMFDPEAIFTGNSYTSEAGKNYPMNKVLSLGLIVNL